MAFKKYAYYNKGNKVALIEQADSTSSGFLAVAHCTIEGGYTTKDTCEAAGGQWIPGSSGSTDTVGEYKSPVETVANGLEIEYTYAPTYNSGEDVVSQISRASMNGWYIDESGYLNLLKTNFDWDLGSGVGYVADAWIYINGSSMWQGIHKIKSLGTEAYHGNIQLYTKFPNNTGGSIYTSATSIVFDTDETATFSSAEDFAGEIGIGGYIAIIGQASLTSGNGGIFKISAIGDGELTVSKRYTMADTSATSQVTPDDFESESAAVFVSETVSCKAYKAYRDPHFITVATAMEDETFELDLTRYQANAVVYYLQAKKFEDAGDIEKHEYYMRKFTKQLEKASSSRKYGPHIVQGHWNMRK